MSDKRSKPKAPAKSKGPDKATLTKIGVGAAIGSAAVAAALLYVNHVRKDNDEPSAPQDAEPTD